MTMSRCTHRHCFPSCPEGKSNSVIVDVSLNDPFAVRKKPAYSTLGYFVTVPWTSLTTMLVEVSNALPSGRRAGQLLSVGLVRQSSGIVRPGVKPISAGSEEEDCGVGSAKTADTERRNVVKYMIMINCGMMTGYRSNVWGGWHSYTCRTQCRAGCKGLCSSEILQGFN
jgi:hypothetical protein